MCTSACLAEGGSRGWAGIVPPYGHTEHGGEQSSDRTFGWDLNETIEPYVEGTLGRRLD